MFKWLNDKVEGRSPSDKNNKVRYDMTKVPTEALAALILELEYQCEG